MGFRSGKTLLGLLGRIGNDNAKKEFYLTDAVALARGDRLEARMVKSNAEEVLGVNSRAELAEAEGADAAAPPRRRPWPMARRWSRPRRCFSAMTPRIGKDVVIEPHVVIGERVVIEDGATIKSFCHMEKCPHRPRRDGRAVRAAEARRQPRQGRACRQFRRDQAVRDRRGRQG